MIDVAEIVFCTLTLGAGLVGAFQSAFAAWRRVPILFSDRALLAAIVLCGAAVHLLPKLIGAYFGESLRSQSESPFWNWSIVASAVLLVSMYVYFGVRSLWVRTYFLGNCKRGLEEPLIARAALELGGVTVGPTVTFPHHPEIAVKLFDYGPPELRGIMAKSRASNEHTRDLAEAAHRIATSNSSTYLRSYSRVWTTIWALLFVAGIVLSYIALIV